MNNNRNPGSSYVQSVRPLVLADLASLRQPSARPTIKKLRDSHHIIARLLASGCKLHEIARQTGYSMSRISILRSSPAMIELVEKYHNRDDEVWRESRDEFYDAIHDAGSKAWRQINDALDDAEDGDATIPINRLLAIADSAADRIGYQKKSTQINVNVDFAAKLEAAMARSRRATIFDEQLPPELLVELPGD